MGTEGGAETPMVKVRIDRLFQVIKTLIDGGLADAVVERYREQVVMIPLDQAISFKAFVEERVAQSAAADAAPGKLNTLSVQKIKSAMPLDFGHCT